MQGGPLQVECRGAASARTAAWSCAPPRDAPCRVCQRLGPRVANRFVPPATDLRPPQTFEEWSAKTSTRCSCSRNPSRSWYPSPASSPPAPALARAATSHYPLSHSLTTFSDCSRCPALVAGCRLRAHACPTPPPAPRNPARLIQDHPDYEAPRLKTTWMQMLPRMMCGCAILVVIVGAMVSVVWGVVSNAPGDPLHRKAAPGASAAAIKQAALHAASKVHRPKSKSKSPWDYMMGVLSR